MKVTLVIHHFLPQYRGGVEIYALRQAHWLTAHEHQVEVVCIEAIDHGGPEAITASRDMYEGLQVWRLAFDQRRAPDSWRWGYANPWLADWFADHFRRVRPDLVHFHGGYLMGVLPLAEAVKAGLASVLTLHDYWYLCPRWTLQRGDGSLCIQIPEDPAGCAWCQLLESRRFRLPEQLSGGRVGKVAQAFFMAGGRRQVADRRAQLLPTLALPQAVVVPSRFLLDQVAPYVPAERLHLSRHGIDLAPFLTNPRSATGSVLRIGYLGQIKPHKGVTVLIEAFRLLKPGPHPIELHLYGGMEAQPDYGRRLRALSGRDERIHFHGSYDNARVAEILGALDLTVVPSVWHEIGPLVALESFAAGTPVVGSALGNLTDLIHDGVDGLLFQAGDVADLAGRLQGLLDAPARLHALQAGVRRPRSLDDEMMQITAIYGQAMLPKVVG